jgi:L-alanine-DL-glutamate epimerase-like enolase superfamily enzyme
VKVKDVKLHIMSVDVPRGSVAVDQGTFGGETEIELLRIITEEGIEGNCFVGTYNHSGRPFFDPIIKVLKPEIVGRDAAERERLWSRLGHLIFRMRVPMPAWAAVDIALWDIMGKVAGVPVYHLLGIQRDKILAYASSAYHPTVEEYAEEALSFKGRGYQAYKFHPGG